ncbi:unnamed protein product [Bursaphelenchus xylophilus]|uniref:(pine wood nematode) hypothetical protein n=1 Tax=Bursaphelenchus xylophilus TaxID=6326 RepID=A0A1I7SSU2_BURXY|nr:unnamed protein product [Bursaphelenchus xylophilus]CAG9108880.1 unnamed protein product [Bursaphelenchus xylophilus]
MGKLVGIVLFLLAGRYAAFPLDDSHRTDSVSYGLPGHVFDGEDENSNIVHVEPHLQPPAPTHMPYLDLIDQMSTSDAPLAGDVSNVEPEEAQATTTGPVDPEVVVPILQKGSQESSESKSAELHNFHQVSVEKGSSDSTEDRGGSNEDIGEFSTTQRSSKFRSLKSGMRSFDDSDGFGPIEKLNDLPPQFGQQQGPLTQTESTVPPVGQSTLGAVVVVPAEESAVSTDSPTAELVVGQFSGAETPGTEPVVEVTTEQSTTPLIITDSLLTESTVLSTEHSSVSSAAPSTVFESSTVPVTEVTTTVVVPTTGATTEAVVDPIITLSPIENPETSTAVEFSTSPVTERTSESTLLSEATVTALVDDPAVSSSASYALSTQEYTLPESTSVAYERGSTDPTSTESSYSSGTGSGASPYVAESTGPVYVDPYVPTESSGSGSGSGEVVGSGSGSGSGSGDELNDESGSGSGSGSGDGSGSGGGDLGASGSGSGSGDESGYGSGIPETSGSGDGSGNDGNSNGSGSVSTYGVVPVEGSGSGSTPSYAPVVPYGSSSSVSNYGQPGSTRAASTDPIIASTRPPYIAPSKPQTYEKIPIEKVY